VTPIDEVIPSALAGEPVDRVTAMITGLSRSVVARPIDGGSVRLDGDRVDVSSRRVTEGQRLSVELPEISETRPMPDSTVDVPVVHDDTHLIVVDKPAGMVVHPAAGNPDATLVNALIAHCGASLSGIGGVLRPGIVHRLDKDTSGVMVVAKTPQAHERLVEMFQQHALERGYLAIALGRPPQSITYDTFHARSPAHRKKFTSRGDRGRRAVTHLETIELLHGSALVRCRLETGRTHQIRVHLAEHGHPVLGDPLYGKSIGDPELRRVSTELGRQALHAVLLAFTHPITGEPMRFETEPPESFQRALESLRIG